MPEAHSREERQRSIREILRSSAVPSQDELVEQLRSRGHDVTQSSVSRDLREIGVAKVEGRYVLSGDVGVSSDIQVDRVLRDGLLSMTRGGGNLLIMHTVVGGASRVALAIDQSGWPEVAGTIAGDDTIFVATASAADQKRLRERLAAWEVSK